MNIIDIGESGLFSMVSNILPQKEYCLLYISAFNSGRPVSIYTISLGVFLFMVNVIFTAFLYKVSTFRMETPPEVSDPYSSEALRHAFSNFLFTVAGAAGLLRI